MGLFGGSKSKSRTNVTNETTVISPVTSGLEDSVSFSNVGGGVDYNVELADYNAVDESFKFAGNVSDDYFNATENTVEGVLNLANETRDDTLGFSSNLITLLSDRFAEQSDNALNKTVKISGDANQRVAEAFGTAAQGGINTERLLSGIFYASAAVAGLWVVFGRKKAS